MWEKLWKDPVWSKVIATGIIAAVGGLGAYLLGYWPVVAGAASSGWVFLLASSSISNWIIALLAIAALPAVMLVAALAWQLIKGEDGSATTTGWTSYTTDEFFGLRWRWSYIGGSIVRLYAFCPKCDYQVFSHNVSSYNFIDRTAFSCDSCNSDLVEIDESEAQINSKVERFIQQKIRNNTWRSAGAT